MDRKRDFQAVIAAIRDEGGKRFPKATMTGRQEELGTATVNCGGEWGTPSSTQAMADKIMADERFQDFLERQKGTARIEAKGGSYPYYQIRITFKKEG